MEMNVEGRSCRSANSYFYCSITISASISVTIFKMLMIDTRKWQCNASTHDVAGRQAISLELKVLGVLRILGRGSCLNGITELSSISESAMHNFLHSFTSWFRAEMYPRMATQLKSYSALEIAMGPYCALGLNGAIGSPDVVHIPWGRCAKNLKTLHTGKEGYPTIAYNRTGLHDGSFSFCTPGSYGSCNDKTIVCFDSSIDLLRTYELYTTMKYSLINGMGELE